jgi:Raf kinase inhibitor-like YbhB/YbcL family protein
MLEHVPGWLGALLRNVRAGGSKLAIVQPELGSGFAAIALSSPAFANRARLPLRFTADGEGISPPLVWDGVPEGTRSLALIVEDPDAPALQPFVHAIVWDLPSDLRRLDEGAIAADTGAVLDIGRNSYMGRGWLPPDPPTGHGVHDYVFQLFALSDVDELGDSPGRHDVIAAMEGRVLAAGMLVGTYSREEEAPIGDGRAALA